MTTESTESTPSSRAILLVAAKSLQSYVLASDKLKEMVGATELIEDFCSKPLATQILGAMNIQDGEVLTGAAGQITISMPSLTSARRAAALWPWFAAQLAPGLEVHVGIGSLAHGYLAALDICQSQIARSRNRPPAILPAAAPPHRRNPRSGLVAVGLDRRDPDGEVPVDAPGLAKRSKRNQRDGRQADSGLEAAADIFATFGLNERTRPKSFEEITQGGGQGDRTYLAIVHADGNGFGTLLMNLRTQVESKDMEWSIGFFGRLSEVIREIGTEAAKEAIRQMESNPHHVGPDGMSPGESIKPWLPIVQAGDDITLVIRADLAFDFLVAYLKAFESVSRDKLDTLAKEYGELQLPKNLTAGGAIVYCKTQHPFAQAYALCESLAASRAKGRAVREPEGNPRSALAFHRISASTSPTDLAEIVDSELRCTDNAPDRLELGCQTWFLDETQDFNVKHLEDLRRAMELFPSGSRRQILSDLRTDRSEAKARLRRMLTISKRNGSEEKMDALSNALKALHGHPDELWSAPTGDRGTARSAVPDALVLIEVAREATTR